MARRTALLLDVASELRTGISVGELHSLMPVRIPMEEFRLWLELHPDLVRIEDGRAYTPTGFVPSDPARRERGSRYRATASSFVAGAFGPLLDWVRCVGVTGSTAYGEPESGDDIDLLIITRTGALWAFLTLAYLVLRWLGQPKVETRRVPLCLNYVVDDIEARREYANPAGFLVAREALSVVPVRGEAYYRDLLASAPWLGQEAPRLFDARRSSGEIGPALRAPRAVRWVNAALYPWMATYLQLSGLARNQRLRREGRIEDAFRTRTGFRRFAIVSARFERLRDRYGTVPIGVDGSAPRRPVPVEGGADPNPRA